MDDTRAVIGTSHDDPHFMVHPITDENWCTCTCHDCNGHAEGLEGLDCTCEQCGCRNEHYELANIRRTTAEWLGGQ